MNFAPRTLALRSRITNGRKILNELDGRSAEARRYRDLYAAFASDFGGPERMTEAEKALARHAAASVAAIERAQSAMLAGRGEVDLSVFGRLMNSTTRLLLRLRLQQKQAPSDEDTAANPILSRMKHAKHEARG